MSGYLGNDFCKMVTYLKKTRAVA